MIFFNTWQEEKQVEHKMRNRKPVSGGVEVVGRGEGRHHLCFPSLNKWIWVSV